MTKLDTEIFSWAKNLPPSWDVKPLWSTTTATSVRCTELDMLSVYLDKGVIPAKDGDLGTHAASLDLGSYQLVEPGDFVLNNQQAWRGSVGVSFLRGIISPAYIILKLKEELDWRYANYALRSNFMSDQYMLASRGVGSIQRQVHSKSLRIVAVLLPPLDTQKRIAEFLDTKTKSIDELITKKEQFIELLKEKRAAIITRAVTKGLDSQVKLKPSGIGWVNEVPASWTELPLKFLFNYSQGGVWGDEPANNEDDIICVRVADFDVLTLTAHSDDFTYRNLPGIKSKFLLNERSLLLEKSGGGEQQPVGRVVQYLGSEKATCSNFIQKMQLKSGHNTRFIALLFCALYFTGETKKAIKQTTGIQNLDMGYFLRTSVFLPTYEEQSLIVDYVDKESTLIIETVRKIESQIQKLKEYRSSLIYSAVTGKINI